MRGRPRCFAQAASGESGLLISPAQTPKSNERARRASSFNEDGVRERFASSSHSIVQGAQEVVAMTVKSWRGLVVGAFIALVVPISYWVLALLVENGIAPYDQTHALFGP